MGVRGLGRQFGVVETEADVVGGGTHLDFSGLGKDAQPCKITFGAGEV